jgi:hypothetical protein
MSGDSPEWMDWRDYSRKWGEYDVEHWAKAGETVANTAFFADALVSVPLTLSLGAERAAIQSTLGTLEKAVAEADAVVSDEVTTLSYRPSSGALLQGSPGKTTTILGNYKQDMKAIISEMNAPESVDFGPKPGAFNVLNVPGKLYQNPVQFWNEYNQPWLEAAIERNDNFIFATKPDMNVFSRLNPVTGKFEITGFGREYLFLRQNGMASKLTY